MAKEDLTSKFAVILHADVAGSTQMVQQDEHLAHDRIQDTFHRFSNIITKYSGRVLELRGDALLAEFDRPSDAVSATLAFQSHNKEFISSINDDLKPGIRVGIAMGEVVIADNTITGAGVVIAQRVEQLADTGGLCITAAVRESLPKRMPFDLKDMGEHELKGFEQPVKVFKTTLMSGESIPQPVPISENRRSFPAWKHAGFLIVAVAVLLAGIIYSVDTGKEQAGFKLPDRPSIVILPFDNLSGEKDQDYFADGMTDDLLTGLSNLPELFVISRNTSFSYKDKSLPISEIAEELGVRYVLEGSVRKAGDTVRVNVQLTDTLSGGNIWAQKFDGYLDEVFELQDEVVSGVVYSLDENINPKKIEIETKVPQAYDLYLQGLKHFHVRDPDNMFKAVEFFKQAITLDPEFYTAHAQLAAAYGWIADSDWESKFDIHDWDIVLMMRDSLNIAKTRPTATTDRLRAWFYLLMETDSLALDYINKSIALNPNEPDSYRIKAQILVRTGPAKEAEETALRAIRMDPNVAASYIRLLGRSLFDQERFTEAANELERAARLEPDIALTHIYLAATYGYLGQQDKARAALDRVDEIRSELGQEKITIKLVSAWYVWVGTEFSYRGRLLTGLKKAGVPWE